jgi:hypothetical protein
MIVSLGTDCIVSMFCDKYKLKRATLPFDWCVSYNGVSKCFDDDFKHFVDTIDKNRINKYDVYFHHDFQDNELYNQDKDKYIRRCTRLQELLKNILLAGENSLINQKLIYENKNLNIRLGWPNIKSVKTFHNLFFSDFSFQEKVLMTIPEFIKEIQIDENIINFTDLDFDQKEKSCTWGFFTDTNIKSEIKFGSILKFFIFEKLFSKNIVDQLTCQVLKDFEWIKDWHIRWGHTLINYDGKKNFFNLRLLKKDWEKISKEKYGEIFLNKKL